MKEKIFDALKTKFAGVKDEILERIASKASKTIKTDEEVATYIEGVTIQTLLDAYGDNRATDATKTAVANYEKKHKIKDGKPVEEPKSAEPTGGAEIPEDAPEWAKMILATNKALADKISVMEGERSTTSRKGKLAEALKEAPEHIRKMYESNFEAMRFDDDQAFDTWLEGTKPIIADIVARETARGAVIHPRGGGGSASQKGEVNPALKSQVDAAKANPATPAHSATILGMPTT